MARRLGWGCRTWDSLLHHDHYSDDGAVFSRPLRPSEFGSWCFGNKRYIFAGNLFLRDILGQH